MAKTSVLDAEKWMRAHDFSKNPRESYDFPEQKEENTGFLTGFLSQLDNKTNFINDNAENNPMLDEWRKTGDYINADFENEEKWKPGQADTDSYIGSAINAAVKNGAATIGGLADFLNMRGLGDKMEKISQYSSDQNQISPELSWDYITSPHGLTRSTFEMVGSNAALLPFAMMVPEALAMRVGGTIANGIGKLGGNALLSGLEKAGYENLAKSIASKGREAATMGAQWMATAAPESGSEAGGTQRLAEQEGLDDPNGRAWKTFLGNLPLLAASKFVEGATLGKGLLNFPGKTGESLATRALMAPVRATPTMLAEGTQNLIEEAGQQGIQNYSTDKPYGVMPWNWTDDQWEAAKEGFAGSLIPGLAGGIGHAMTTDMQEAHDNGNAAPEPHDEDTPQSAAANMSDNDSSDVLSAAFAEYEGKRMPNGENGCVEAVVRLGKGYSPFLAKEFDEDTNNVSVLLEHAEQSNIPVIDYDASKLQRGYVIVYEDTEDGEPVHVVIADGNGGYVGNSTRRQQVISSDSVDIGSSRRPVKIIKTGLALGQENLTNTLTQAAPEGNEGAYTPQN